MRGFGWRSGLIAAVTLAAVFYLIPPKDRIRLGLDLQGGIHLVLEVQAEKAVDSKLDRYFTELRNRLQIDDIRTRLLRKEGRQIRIALHRPDDRSKLEEVMGNYPDLGLQDVSGTPPSTSTPSRPSRPSR